MSEPVIGMSSIDSIEVMSCSGYWTPTKYWLWVLGSIQKFLLLKVIDEFRAATTFCITSCWVIPRSAALVRSTLTTNSG